MKKNAYFQIQIDSNQVFLVIHQAVDGGEDIQTAEVSAYLSARNLPFEIVALDAFLKSGKERLKLCDGNLPLEAENIAVTISEDKMTAYARFYAPFAGGGVKNFDDIVSDLKLRGIKYGTNKENIEDFLKTREYCKTFIVAQGLPVTEGSDGTIEYLFKTDLSAKPAMNEDGSVDYHNLDNISHIMAGDELAKLTPEVPGHAGMNVLGEIIKPRDVKKLRFQYGNNISVSEDGLTLVAGINGHVNLVEDKVFVSSVMELTNVDASTGDIEYNGGILVRGDVKTGYKIKATGDIEIKGAVENAVVESGGQIIVARGINGMAQGVLRAKGNVLCKYIQNAKVYSGGYVEADAIIHSEVVATDYVRVQGKKGYINGGTIRAGKEVEVKTLGSEMGSDATIEVGTDPAMRDRYNRLKKEVAEYNKSIAQNEPLAIALIQKMKQGQRMSPEQIKLAQTLAKTVSEQKIAVQNGIKEMGVLEIELDKDSESVVRVTGIAYPGSNISISGATTVLKTEYHYCRFKKEGADVKMVAM